MLFSFAGIFISHYSCAKGNEAHNVQLPKDRAKAVLDALAVSGKGKRRTEG